MVNIGYYLDIRRKNEEELYQLKLNVTYNRKTALISLGIKLNPEWWDGKKQQLTNVCPNRSAMKLLLDSRMLEFTKIVVEVNSNAEIKAKGLDAIKAEFVKAIKPKDGIERKVSFIEFFKQCTEQKSKGTLDTYRQTLSKLEKCGVSNAMYLDDITTKWLDWFVTQCQRQGNSTNYIAIHLRNIRAVMNRAIDNELTNNYPFRRYKIKREPTRNRNIPTHILREIIQRKITNERDEQLCDMFKLSMMLIGINCIDLYGLKKSDVVGNILTYKRAKTGKLYTIKLLPDAQRLLAKYVGCGEWLLNIRSRYSNNHNFYSNLNKCLKRCYGDLMPNISSYYARHTWATIAAELEIPKETISASLGHEIGSSITSIYINFNQKKIDDANEAVCRYIGLIERKKTTTIFTDGGCDL